MYISKYAISAAFMLCLGSLLASDPVFAQSAGVNSTSGDLPIGAAGTPFMWMGGTTNGAGVPAGSVYFGSTSSPTISINSVNGMLHMNGNLGIGLGAVDATSTLVVGTTVPSSFGQEAKPIANFTVDGVTGNVTTQGTMVIGNEVASSNGRLTIWGPTVIQNPNTITSNGAAGYWAFDPLPGGNWLVSDGNGSAWGAIGTNDDEPLMFSTDKVWIAAFNSFGYNPCPSCVVIGGGTSMANGGGGIPGPSHSLDIFPTNNGTATSDGAVRAYAFYHNSDMRLKKDIHPIVGALDKLMQIHGVEFNWKYDGHSDVGVVAQDVAKVFPEAVSADKTNDHMMAVEYDSLAGPMIESIRELKMENDAMKAQLNEISASLKALKEENARLQSVNVDGHDGVVRPSSFVEH